jgi:hypothetical protein
MKKIFFCLLLASKSILAQDCHGPIDLLVLGDSQTGATWSKSYFGNFLQECLNESFVILGKGGSIPGSWIGKGGLDQIEIIQRTPKSDHQNIGSGEMVPLCKKRLDPMLKSYLPKKVLFFFGDNYIASSDEMITQDIGQFAKTLEQNFISKENCFFLTPTFEMEVKTKRNVSRKNIANTLRINQIIKNNLDNKCQMIDGIELMKDSPYFDGKELLKRVQIQDRIGCAGAAMNDNIHLCGAAAEDMAKRICQVIR